MQLKSLVVGVVAGAVVGSAGLAAAGIPETHVQKTPSPVCTSGYNYWWAAVAAYNARHRGTTPTVKRPYNAGNAKPFTALGPITQELWMNAATEAVKRACYPLVP